VDQKKKEASMKSHGGVGKLQGGGKEKKERYLADREEHFAHCEQKGRNRIRKGKTEGGVLHDEPGKKESAKPGERKRKPNVKTIRLRPGGLPYGRKKRMAI